MSFSQQRSKDITIQYIGMVAMEYYAHMYALCSTHSLPGMSMADSNSMPYISYIIGHIPDISYIT